MLGYGIYGNLWESTLQLDPNTTFNTTKPWQNVWNFHGNFHIFLGPFREMGVDDPAMCCSVSQRLIGVLGRRKGIQIAWQFPNFWQCFSAEIG